MAVALMAQTAEHGSFRRDLGCGEGCRCAKQLPSADRDLRGKSNKIFVKNNEN